MIEARNDKSNISLDFFRNRIRLELRPMLEKYNPKINEALLRTANIAGDELAFLEDQAQRLWMVTAKRKENTIILNKTRMQSQPAALRRQLLRMAMADLAGNLKDIESRHIEEMMELLEKPAGSQISLPYGLKFSAVYNHYLLGPNPTALCPFPLLEGEATLDIPGETRFSGWRITARIVERGNLDIKKTVRAPGIKNYAIPRAGFGAYFDLDRLGNDVKVRAIQTGDRFQPFGLADMKKVGRFMIDTRIPHDWRARIPIIVSTDKVAWVTGYRTDDRFKVTETTRTILKLQFHLQQSPTT
jgi:tRNA(Ile)-lysidine synthase